MNLKIKVFLLNNLNNPILRYRLFGNGSSKNADNNSYTDQR
ncbi:MAG: hypothetical protein Q3M30_05305 [Candidatus Electrothrix sp. Rat3]|nr:hypothetical protein [Candidatus Electrothrix rattekaaiensis]